MKITVRQLRKMRFCKSAIDEFKGLFGESAEINRVNVNKALKSSHLDVATYIAPLLPEDVQAEFYNKAGNVCDVGWEKVDWNLYLKLVKKYKL